MGEGGHVHELCARVGTEPPVGMVRDRLRLQPTQIQITLDNVGDRCERW